MPENPIKVVAITPPQHVLVEEENKFTFTFSESIRNLGDASVLCFINEPKIIKRTALVTKKLVKSADAKEGEVMLTFPEVLAGAKLVLTFVMYSSQRKIELPLTLEKIVNVKRKDGKQEITSVNWSEPQGALWGIQTARRMDICRNEYGFLHIHTQGLFGHEVYIELLDDIDCIYPDKRDMKDNVVSIPYAMDDIWATSVAQWKEFLYKKEIQLRARVHHDPTKVKNGVVSPLMILKNEINEDNPAQLIVQPPVKTIINDEELEKPILTKAKCSLEFRPNHEDENNTYTGDYGFDWVRMGDTCQPKYFNDLTPWEELMGKYYKAEGGTYIVEDDSNKYTRTDFREDQEKNDNIYMKRPGSFELDSSFGEQKMFKRLTRRFKRIIYPWNDTKTKQPFVTYTPIMSIMMRNEDKSLKGAKTIKLGLYLIIKQMPEKILFEFNNKQAKSVLLLDREEITPQQMADKYPGCNKIKTTLSITCTGEFDDEYTLFAVAIAGNKRTVCGMLRILPNGVQFQHRVKVVIFNVLFKVNGKLYKPEEQFFSENKKRINEILGQALTIAEIEEQELNLTKDQDIKVNYCLRGNDVIFDKDKIANFINNNLEEDRKKQKDRKYDLYHRIYNIGADATVRGMALRANKASIVFNKTDKETATHELLHLLELFHTFDGFTQNTLFTFKVAATDNIMDYIVSETADYNRKSLYHWQWQIINPKIR